MISRAERRPGQAGFTLIELIVVFAILGLTLALLASRISGPSPALQLRAAANRLAADMRVARSRAIVGNKETEVRIDVERHLWQAADGSINELPATARISLTTLAGAVESEHVAAIRFEPDGSATGGRVELVDGKRKTVVAVEWLTGRVSVSDAD
jgi:general secretion pathway protein H